MEVSKLTKAVSYILLTIISIVTFLPMYIMIITSFKSDIQLYESILMPPFNGTIFTYIEAFKYSAPYILNSMIVTVGIVGLSLVCSVCAAFAFYKYDFWGKEALFACLLALMMIPGFMTLAPQFLIAKNLNILNTYIVQILPPTGAFSVLSTFLIRTYLEGLPKSLFEAAEVEGANTLRMLLSLVVPLSTSILTVVLINNSVLGWNNYIWPLVSANRQDVRAVIIAIIDFPTPDYYTWGTKFASYVLTSIPLLVLFAFNTRSFVSGITSGAVKA